MSVPVSNLQTGKSAKGSFEPGWRIGAGLRMSRITAVEMPANSYFRTVEVRAVSGVAVFPYTIFFSTPSSHFGQSHTQKGLMR